MDKISLIEYIVDNTLGEFISEGERNFLKENIPSIIPEAFGISEDCSMAVAYDNPKTALLFYDRIWSFLPQKDEMRFFGGTYFEIVNVIFIFLKNAVYEVLSGHSDQRTMLLRLQWLHELFLATGDFYEPDFEKDIPLHPAGIRSIVESVAHSTGKHVAAVYNSHAEYNREYKPGETEIIISCFTDLKIVNEKAITNEQVIEFRKDNDARRKYRKFIHWLDKEMVGKPVTFVEEEIASRFEAYEWALKKHGISTLRWGTFFIFAYFGCEIGLTMIGALHAKTVTIRYPGGAASYHCQGERETKNL
jgi:hypothetical protein